MKIGKSPWIPLMLVCVLDKVLSDSEDSSQSCPDNDVWLAAESSFDMFTVLPNTTDYNQVVSILTLPTAMISGRKKRQTTGEQPWCAVNNGYYITHSADGDVCCQTERAICMWHGGVDVPDDGTNGGGGGDNGDDGPSATSHGTPSVIPLYPMWKASVLPDGSITVRYQYFYDIKCNSQASTCANCVPIQHTRKVLMASEPPTMLDPTAPGEYGHGYTPLAAAVFHLYLETTYCACIQ